MDEYIIWHIESFVSLCYFSLFVKELFTLLKDLLHIFIWKYFKTFFCICDSLLSFGFNNIIKLGLILKRWFHLFLLILFEKKLKFLFLLLRDSAQQKMQVCGSTQLVATGSKSLFSHQYQLRMDRRYSITNHKMIRPHLYSIQEKK